MIIHLSFYNKQIWSVELREPRKCLGITQHEMASCNIVNQAAISFPDISLI